MPTPHEITAEPPRRCGKDHGQLPMNHVPQLIGDGTVDMSAIADFLGAHYALCRDCIETISRELVAGDRAALSLWLLATYKPHAGQVSAPTPDMAASALPVRAFLAAVAASLALDDPLYTAACALLAPREKSHTTFLLMVVENAAWLHDYNVSKLWAPGQYDACGTAPTTPEETS